MREYVDAVAASDARRVRELVIYVRMDDPADAGQVVLGADLPEVCVAREIEELLEAGVTSASDVAMMQLAASDVALEGTPETVSYSIEVGQISLPDGSSVGRGIVALAGGARVQAAPDPSCETALDGSAT